MTEAKHTPGPWEPKGQTGDDAKFYGTMHRIKADGAWVAFVPTWENDVGESAEAAANASLIAAAPDLFAILQTLTNAMPKYGGIFRFDGDELAAARAAIAKATGAAQ